jgi:serine/threonine protein kinase
MKSNMTMTDQKFCLAPGAILGDHYQIIKRVGQGGMGSVYMAYDTRLDLRVAVKVIYLAGVLVHFGSVPVRRRPEAL